MKGGPAPPATDLSSGPAGAERARRSLCRRRAQPEHRRQGTTHDPLRARRVRFRPRRHARTAQDPGQTYVNPAFGATADVLRDWRAGQPPENGAGCSSLRPDGQATTPCPAA